MQSNTNTLNNNPINTIPNHYTTSGTTSTFNHWSSPIRIQVNEYNDHIEMIYKQTSMISYTLWPAPQPEERIFKIIFSCINGKWNKSEPIYGKIIPSQDEYYQFDDEI